MGDEKYPLKLLCDRVSFPRGLTSRELRFDAGRGRATDADERVADASEGASCEDEGEGDGSDALKACCSRLSFAVKVGGATPGAPRDATAASTPELETCFDFSPPFFPTNPEYAKRCDRL